MSEGAWACAHAPSDELFPKFFGEGRCKPVWSPESAEIYSAISMDLPSTDTRRDTRPWYNLASLGETRP